MYIADERRKAAIEARASRNEENNTVGKRDFDNTFESLFSSDFFAMNIPEIKKRAENTEFQAVDFHYIPGDQYFSSTLQKKLDEIEHHYSTITEYVPGNGTKYYTHPFTSVRGIIDFNIGVKKVREMVVKGMHFPIEESAYYFAAISDQTNMERFGEFLGMKVELVTRMQQCHDPEFGRELLYYFFYLNEFCAIAVRLKEEALKEVEASDSYLQMLQRCREQAEAECLTSPVSFDTIYADRVNACKADYHERVEELCIEKAFDLMTPDFVYAGIDLFIERAATSPTVVHFYSLDEKAYLGRDIVVVCHDAYRFYGMLDALTHNAHISLETVQANEKTDTLLSSLLTMWIPALGFYVPGMIGIIILIFGVMVLIYSGGGVFNLKPEIRNLRLIQCAKAFGIWMVILMIVKMTLF